MKLKPIDPKRIIQLLLLVILILILLFFPFQLPTNLGVTDFRPYWSSSYLLAHGQDFSDSLNLDIIERNLTGWSKPYTMQAWFAPLGNLILLPYTFLSFSKATYYWLITNIFIVLISSLLIWQKQQKQFWIPIIVTFTFSFTLISLTYGQVNTLVLLGLALFLVFKEKKKDFLAGIGLVLTTVKPHLVIITLPLLVLNLIKEKKWRVLSGFMFSLLVSMLILTFLNPTWAVSFSNLIVHGMEIVRMTPSINGLLIIMGEYFWGKWLWILVLITCSLFLLKDKKPWDYRRLIDRSILIGLIISPIGWSYDFIILLFPILWIWEKIATGVLTKWENIIFSIALLIINIFSFYLRFLEVDDIWFFWTPILIAMTFFYYSKKLHASQEVENKKKIKNFIIKSNSNFWKNFE